jgi:hypothetical protein
VDQYNKETQSLQEFRFRVKIPNLEHIYSNENARDTMDAFFKLHALRLHPNRVDSTVKEIFDKFFKARAPKNVQGKVDFLNRMKRVHPNSPFPNSSAGQGEISSSPTPLFRGT